MKNIILSFILSIAAFQNLLAMRTQPHNPIIHQSQRDIAIIILNTHAPLVERTKVLVIDLDMITVAHEKYGVENSQLTFTQCNIDQALYPPDNGGIYDIALSVNLRFQYIKNKPQALQNMFNYLKPGGTLLIAFPIKNPDLYYYEVLLGDTTGFTDVSAELTEFTFPFDNKQEFLSVLILKATKPAY
jgi:SAM-dependent methyltransferase